MDGWFRKISFWVGFGGDLTASLLVSGRVPSGWFGLQQDPLAADGFPFVACKLWFGMEPGPLGLSSKVWSGGCKVRNRATVLVVFFEG